MGARTPREGQAKAEQRPAAERAKAEQRPAAERAKADQRPAQERAEADQGPAVGRGKAAEAEPGMPGNPVKLTDPKMMRALAHPARIAIWMHIALRGSATATECAEVAGLSPSACSYHLRTLARYGFVEEDRASAADGRERPWRARLLAFTMEDRPDTPAAGRVASRLLVENIRADAEEIRVRYLDRKSEYPADWQAAAGEMFSVAHVTPDELDELRAKVMEIMAPYVRLDPAERMAGALPVRVMLDMFPWFRPEEAQ
jgi:predicted transcriptional regulator